MPANSHRATKAEIYNELLRATEKLNQIRTLCHSNQWIERDELRAILDGTEQQ